MGGQRVAVLYQRPVSHLKNVNSATDNKQITVEMIQSFRQFRIMSHLMNNYDFPLPSADI